MISLIHAGNQRSPHFAATSSTFTFHIEFGTCQLPLRHTND